MILRLLIVAKFQKMTEKLILKNKLEKRFIINLEHILLGLVFIVFLSEKKLILKI